MSVLQPHPPTPSPKRRGGAKRFSPLPTSGRGWGRGLGTESEKRELHLHDDGLRSNLFQCVLSRAGQLGEKQVEGGIAPLENVRGAVVENRGPVEEDALIQPAGIGCAQMGVLLCGGF